WQIGRSTRLVQKSIYVEAHDVRFPLDREDMEIIKELLTVGQRVGRTHAARTRVTWSMKSSMNNRWLLADVFHDVDLATVGPARGIDVLTQQPKCRPDALAVRNPDSCLKPSIG